MFLSVASVHNQTGVCTHTPTQISIHNAIFSVRDMALLHLAPTQLSLVVNVSQSAPYRSM